MMFIRFTVLGAEDCEPPPSIDPTVILVSGGTDHPVTSVDAVQPTPVAAGGAAFATVRRPGPGGRGVYLLELFKATQQPIDWQIRFRNNDPAAERRFTWVVADQEPQTRQPWIDAPTTLAFEVPTGQVRSSSFHVANCGTGRLDLNDRDGDDLGAGFVLATVMPHAVAPNSCAEMKITFAAPDTTGTKTSVYIVTSNDIKAQPTAGHNQRVDLKATTRRPLWKPGDILVVDSSGTIRLDRSTGAQAKISAGSSGVAVEADGNILVVDQSSNGDARLIRVDRLTGARAVVSSGNMFTGPTGVAVEADGNVLVLNNSAFDGGGAVVRVDRITGEQTLLSSGQLLPFPSSPTGLAVKADGSILVVDPEAFDFAGGVIRVDPVTGEQSPVSSGGMFAAPVGVAVEADGNILIADFGAFDHGGGVIRVDPVTGEQSPVSSGGMLATPTGVAVVPDAGPGGS
jgi:hypothetical protein